MSLMWMIAAGVIAGIVGKLLMPRENAGGLFILALGGAWIAGTIQYSEGSAINFIVPLVGAVSLLLVHAFTSRRAPAEKVEHEDFRRAA
jgi:uncharacterized membrane protein YeaQ/YmgE (transglycosylase-associated protein family)